MLIVLFVGCSKSGPDLAPVSGRVTLDGRPIQFADVTFQPEGKSPGVARTDKDGHYEMMYKRGMMGAPIGPNRVSIAVDTELSHGPQIVPPRYNAQTELKRDVEPGPNEFNFDLTTEAK